MKTALTLLAITVLPAAAADISGSWKLDGHLENVQIHRVCTLQQTDHKLSGKCKNATDEVVLAGEVDGNNVVWKYEVTYDGSKLTLTFNGTLESATVKGSIETTGAKGDFTATKQ